MFQKLFSRFRNSPSFEPEPPQGARLESIIVPKSAFDAADSDPWTLVGAVVTYVNHLIQHGRFTRDEIPQAAIQVYHTDFYLAQVNNGGHAQFIGNSVANLSFVLVDVARGLSAAGAVQHCALFDKMQTWIARHPQEVGKQTGFDGGIAPELAALDSPFYELEVEKSPASLLARWIRRLPNLQVVDDDALSRVLNGVTSLNPELKERSIAADIAHVRHQLSDDLSVGFGLVTASQSPPEPIVHLGAGAQMELAPGRNEVVFSVRTVAADRFCLRTESGFELYEKLQGENPQMSDDWSPEDRQQTSLDDILAYQPPRVGARLGAVPHKLAEISALVCDRFKAEAAIDLLLRTLPAPSRATFVSIRSVGKGQNGRIGATILIVADDGARAFSVILEADGARLLAEPCQKVLSSVSRQDIDAHEKAHSGT